MLSLPPSVKIFMSVACVDMRKGFDGLMAIVKNQWQQDVFGGHLFVFLGHGRNRVKILHWDRGGLVLYCKRLEQGRFVQPKLVPDGDAIELDAVQLGMLLDGINVSCVKRPTLWKPAQEANKK